MFFIKLSLVVQIRASISGLSSFWGKRWRWVSALTALFWLWCVCAQSLPLCLTLCDPMDCSLAGSLSMGFSRQKYRSALPCPPPGDLPDPEIEPMSLTSNLHWQVGSLPLAPPGLIVLILWQLPQIALHSSFVAHLVCASHGTKQGRRGWNTWVSRRPKSGWKEQTGT